MKCYILICIFRPVVCVTFLQDSKIRMLHFFIHYVTLALYISLQKQICCFDHKVVTKVAIKLWL